MFEYSCDTFAAFIPFGGGANHNQGPFLPGSIFLCLCETICQDKSYRWILALFEDISLLGKCIDVS
jgi:hypothetical protein